MNLTSYHTNFARELLYYNLWLIRPSRESLSQLYEGLVARVPVERGRLKVRHIHARSHALAHLPVDHDALAQIHLVGHDSTGKALRAGRLEQPAVPVATRLEGVAARHIVHEQHRLGALAVGAEHLTEDVLATNVEAMKLDSVRGSRHCDGLDAEIDATSHIVRLGEALPVGVEHLRERRLAHRGVADLQAFTKV